MEERVAIVMEEIEDRIANGVPFSEIEDFIQELDLPSEQKDRLWLLAWAESSDLGQRGRRQIIGLPSC